MAPFGTQVTGVAGVKLLHGAVSADFTCDFAAQGCWLFHATNTQVTISGGTLNAALSRTTVKHGAALNLAGACVLGGDLNNTKWEMRVKYDLTGLTNGNINEAVPIVFAATDQDECTIMANNADNIAAIMTASSQSVCERRHRIYSANGTAHLSNPVEDQTDPVINTYFMTFRRESATTARWQLDATAYGCGGFLCLLSSCVQACAIGLDHINMMNYSLSGIFNNVVIYTLDCLEIYDGVNL